MLRKRKVEVTDELQVFADQEEGSAGSGSDVLFTHARSETKLDATQALNIVLDFLRAMEGFRGDLASGFLFHQTFVANDPLMSDGAAEVVNGAASGNDLAGFAFVLENDGRDAVDEDERIGRGHRRVR